MESESTAGFEAVSVVFATIAILTICVTFGCCLYCCFHNTYSERGRSERRRSWQMLEHLQVEFKWEKILKILESAADIAGIEKANAYKRAKTCQDNLRQKRHS